APVIGDARPPAAHGPAKDRHTPAPAKKDRARPDPPKPDPAGEERATTKPASTEPASTEPVLAGTEPVMEAPANDVRPVEQHPAEVIPVVPVKARRKRKQMQR